MKTTDTYHHGNLRLELLEEAAIIISEQGLEHLTIRTLSKRVGVSRTALYRHFTDKTALLCAIAEEGFKRLTSRYKEINSDTSLHASERLQEIGRTYVEFAIRNCCHYRLMFGHEIMQGKRSPELVRAANETFNEFKSAVEAVQREEMVQITDPLALANLSWVLVHGLSGLIIDGQIRITGPGLGFPALLGKEDKRNMDTAQQSIDFSKKILADFWTMIST
jgi:AcrR family transcriptional regulator